MAERSFSHAIAEGDGISVIAAVEDPDAARAAETQRAEALVVRGDPGAGPRGDLAADPLARRRAARRGRAASRTPTCSSSTRSTTTTAGSRSCTGARSSSGSTAPSRCATRRSSSRRSTASTRRSSCSRRRRPTTTRRRSRSCSTCSRPCRPGKLAIADLPLTTPRRGAGARARRLRRGDRLQPGPLAARRRPAARGLAIAAQKPRYPVSP